MCEETRARLGERFSVRVLLGPAATREAVMAALPDADALLFVGHTGSEECEHGLKSHLVLHNDEHFSLKVRSGWDEGCAPPCGPGKFWVP